MSPVARLWLLWLLSEAAGLAWAKVQYKVKCTDDSMVIDVVKTDSVGVVYLEKLKHYTDPNCHPEVNGDKVTFSLSLKNIFECGVTRVKNEMTGQQMFYHRIIVEMIEPENKEVILVKCIVSGSETHSLDKRSVLPAGFQEPEDLNITNYFEGKAPAPILDVGVRQGGQLVTGELNVNPGTPLQMEIFLDKNSAAIYGLLVSYMMVTDTKSQEEIIIFNGCSVDPYLFENFNTVDGDFLTAKFRAFKFPESTYVEFKGTVNVCLDKCRGVECSNGQSGFGRRRREVKAMAPDPNKLFEVTLTTFIKVDYEEGSNTNKGGILKQNIKKENDTILSGKESTSEIEDSSKQLLKLETEEMRNELKYVLIDDANSASVGVPSVMLSFCIMLFGVLFM